MHAFGFISKKIIQYEDNIIFNNVHKINYYIFNQRPYSIADKYIFLNSTLNNIFNNKEIYEEILDYFCNIQKIYFAFSRIAHIFKYKKAKIIIENDLILNPISMDDKYVYCLYQNNCKYLFKIQELIKIINNSIANSCHFFHNPIPIKNPYNNLILNKSTLYNIYFYIKMNTLLNTEIFNLFFATNFDINRFFNDYQHILRDFSIDTYINNSIEGTLMNDICDMIDSHNEFFKNQQDKIIIHDEFPDNILLKAMKPYLKLYLISNYSMIYNIRENTKILLMKKLIEFKKINKLFGRKIITKNRSLYNNNNNNNQITNIVTFNTSYKTFYEIEKELYKNNNFLSSHSCELNNDTIYHNGNRRFIYVGNVDYDNLNNLDYSNDDDNDDDNDERPNETENED